MSPEHGAAIELRRLARDTAADARAVGALSAEISAVAERPGALGPEALAYLAFKLHAWYTGLESALERIARVLEGTVPAGPSSHQDLLRGMTLSLPGVRDVVLAPERLPDLVSLLAFRHFFRHAYSVALDEVELRRHAATVERVASGVEQDLAALCGRVSAQAERLEQG